MSIVSKDKMERKLSLRRVGTVNAVLPNAALQKHGSIQGFQPFQINLMSDLNMMDHRSISPELTQLNKRLSVVELAKISSIT